MKTKHQPIRTAVRHTVLGLILTSGIAATLPAQAGWFSNATDKVHHAASQAAATPGNIGATVKDISAKLNEMFQKFAEGKPLLEKLQQIHVKDNLLDMIEYIRDSRSDYDQFVNGESEMFRNDLKGIVEDFSSINDSFMHRDSLTAQQDIVKNMLDRLPVSMLYLLHKSIGPALQDIQMKLGLLNSQMQVMANVPSVNASMQNPQAFIDQVCDKDNHKGMKTSFRTALAIIKVTASQIELWGEHFKDLAPRDSNITGDVLGEGAGITVSAHPAHKFLVRAFYPAKVVKEVVENYTTLGDALCGN